MQLIVVDPLRFVKMSLSSLAGIFIVDVVVVTYRYIFFVVFVILFLFSFFSNRYWYLISVALINLMSFTLYLFNLQNIPHDTG